MSDPGDSDTRRLADEARAQGSPTAWFERLYVEADAGTAQVPWDRPTPTTLLVQWLAGRDGAGARAVVVGCGYGRDAEYVASLGYATTGFDVSPTVIEAARRRHPGSPVDYAVGDLLDLPDAWRGAFDLVVESNNVQALPPDRHGPAAAGVASLVTQGGTLFVLAARAVGPADGPPWPLERGELDAFAAHGVQVRSVEELETDGVPRWRAVLTR